MRIGELVASAGVSVETVRYYERLGLIPEARRTGGGYRTYTEADALCSAGFRCLS
jgi:DNA-binding transcriptional MerR regulator